MTEAIGNAAGLVWKHLNENGDSSISKVAKETGIHKNDIQRAIGWLAREEKITIEKKGRSEVLALK